MEEEGKQIAILTLTLVHGHFFLFTIFCHIADMSPFQRGVCHVTKLMPHNVFFLLTYQMRD
jgi:hypothetical protein